MCCGTSTDIDSFEEPKERRVHRGRTGAAVDLGATLADSSDCKLPKIRECSVRPLTALVLDALGKVPRLHFPQSFIS